MKPILIETAYLPPLAYTQAWQEAGFLHLEAHENYQKPGFRSRCHLAGPAGRVVLSIPLQKGKNQQQPIRDVKIAYNEPWNRRHWHTIKTCYGSAPLFEALSDQLIPCYEKQPTFLWDWNILLLEVLATWMRPKGKIDQTTDWLPLNTNSASIEDWRQTLKIDTLPKTQPYPQLFEDRCGFIPNLSTLDKLMCTGTL